MFVKKILKILRVSRWSVRCLFLNLYYNFICRSVNSDENSGIFIYPYVVLSVDRRAIIELHGDLYLGIPSIKGNKQISKLLMKPQSKLKVNERCEILDSFDIQIHSNGLFEVDSFHSNVYLEISCGKNITLKGDVMAGRHVRLKDFNGHNVSCERYPFSASIMVEDHVWICTGSTINPGVKIGRGSVVGDNSNVIADIPSESFVCGNPASVIYSDIKWSK